MGGETHSLLPPNNTSIENILKSMKEKTDKIMRPSKKLVDSGTQEIFNMEPKKKLELKPEQLITPPKRRPLVDTESNEVFNIPSETRDHKNILDAANKEMGILAKRVEKLSKKKKQNQWKHKLKHQRYRTKKTYI
jgi:hypothetical protein